MAEGVPFGAKVFYVDDARVRAAMRMQGVVTWRATHVLQISCFAALRRWRCRFLEKQLFT